MSFLNSAEDMIGIESFFKLRPDKSNRASAKRGCKGDAFDAAPWVSKYKMSYDPNPWKFRVTGPKVNSGIFG